MSSKQGNIGVTSENIFPIIKKFLYRLSSMTKRSRSLTGVSV